jgi:hypothetical protein
MVRVFFANHQCRPAAILARFSKCAKDNADPHIWRVGALIEEIRKFENRARIARPPAFAA